MLTPVPSRRREDAFGPSKWSEDDDDAEPQATTMTTTTMTTVEALPMAPMAATPVAYTCNFLTCLTSSLSS